MSVFFRIDNNIHQIDSTTTTSTHPFEDEEFGRSLMR